MNLFNSKVIIALTIALGIGVGVAYHRSSQNNTTTEIDNLNFTTTTTETPSPTTITKPLIVTNSVVKKSPSITKLGDRVLTIEGEIGQNVLLVADDIKRLSLESTAPIYLLINSPGGSVFHGAMVISAMKASKAPVVTVCTMLCASMAAIIHQFGTERQMVEGSILMFHNAAGGEQGYVPQMMSRLNFISHYIDKIDEQIAKRAGVDVNVFKSKLGDEVWLDAEDATDQRFNDKVVSVFVSQRADTPTINFQVPDPGKDTGKNNNPVINLEWK